MCGGAGSSRGIFGREVTQMTSTQWVCYVGGGGAAIILLACFCFWSVHVCIKQFTERTHEKFREHISKEVEEALRIFGEKMCEQIVLQGKKSDSLASLYSMLIDLLRLGKEFADCCTKGEPLQIEKGMRSIDETCTVFFDLYQKESLHFPQDFCAMLDGFRAAQKEAMQGLQRELYGKDSAERSKEAELRQNWLRFEDRITEVMDLVRREFHRKNQASGNFLLKGLSEASSFSIVSDAEVPSPESTLSTTFRVDL
jgi:hypothetical protein